MSSAREKQCHLASTIAGWCWLVVLLTLLLAMCSRCHGEGVPQESLCRVTNKLGEFTNVGSGTLIDKSNAQGLVLTCAHLFSDGVGEIVVEFPGAKSHGARLVDLDREADLAAVVIANPATASAAVEFDVNQCDQLSACGFGPRGEYRCANGPIVGEANTSGQRSILIEGAVRSGDSGGGVFDSQGRLVAVVWGETSGITYASSGPPLRRFLDRVLGRRTAQVYACPNGMCPRVAPQAPQKCPPKRPQQPTVPRQPQLPGVDGERWDELAGRVEQLEADAASRHASLLEQIKQLAKTGAATKLPALFGPVVWAVVAGGTVGGWLVGRLWKRRGAGGRRKKTFRS